MKAIVALLMLPGLVLAEDFTLRDGTKFLGVKVLRQTPAALVVETDAGIAELKFADLPPAVQKTYGWTDPAIAEAARAKIAAEAARQAAAAELAQAAKDKAAAAKARLASPRTVDVVIVPDRLGGFTARELPPGVSHRQSIGGGR